MIFLFEFAVGAEFVESRRSAHVKMALKFGCLGKNRRRADPLELRIGRFNVRTRHEIEILFGSDDLFGAGERLLCAPTDVSKPRDRYGYDANQADDPKVPCVLMHEINPRICGRVCGLTCPIASGSPERMSGRRSELRPENQWIRPIRWIVRRKIQE